MEANGAVTGGLEGAHWTALGGNRYSITWPKFVDTFRIAPDGRSLKGDNNYVAGSVAAQRGPGQRGFPGVWQWNNGAVVTVSQGGGITTGPVSGRWTDQGGGSYKIEWNLGPVDEVVLATDGQSFSGQNQFAVKVGASRAACAN
jgi:hypothetical protein